MYKIIRFIFKLITYPVVAPFIILLVSLFSLGDIITAKNWNEYKEEQRLQWSVVKQIISFD